MTADQRLDQLEPLISESISVLDRHTAQLIRLNNGVGRLTEIATQHSDNISFLLKENIKTNDRLTQLDQRVSQLDQKVTELKTDVTELKTGVAELKQGQSSLDSKLDLILSKLN